MTTNDIDVVLEEWLYSDRMMYEVHLEACKVLDVPVTTVVGGNEGDEPEPHLHEEHELFEKYFEVTSYLIRGALLRLEQKVVHESKVVEAALEFYKDTLVDDQHDGADHKLEIITVLQLLHELNGE